MPNAEIEAIRAAIAANPRPPGLADRRARLDRMSGIAPLPDDVVVTPVSAGGVDAEWTATPSADPSRAMLYLHGGAYVSGSAVSHRLMVAEAGRQAGMRTLALNYRLAPEHPHPAAVEDALVGYRFLLAEGFPAERIVVAGDSAGGGLTLALLVSLRDVGERLPACAWVISPWIDLEMTGASMMDKAAVDPMIQRSYLREVAAQYAGGGDPAAALISPLHADLRGLPPLLIQVGTAETLLDDAVRLSRAVGMADGVATLEIYTDMIHVWHLFHPILEPGRRALAAAGRFVRQHS